MDTMPHALTLDCGWLCKVALVTLIMNREHFLDTTGNVLYLHNIVIVCAGIRNIAMLDHI